MHLHEFPHRPEPRGAAGGGSPRLLWGKGHASLPGSWDMERLHLCGGHSEALSHG